MRTRVEPVIFVCTKRSPGMPSSFSFDRPHRRGFRPLSHLRIKKMQPQFGTFLLFHECHTHIGTKGRGNIVTVSKILKTYQERSFQFMMVPSELTLFCVPCARCQVTEEEVKEWRSFWRSPRKANQGHQSPQYSHDDLGV